MGINETGDSAEQGGSSLLDILGEHFDVEAVNNFLAEIQGVGIDFSR